MKTLIHRLELDVSQRLMSIENEVKSLRKELRVFALIICFLLSLISFFCFVLVVLQCVRFL